VKPDDLAPLPIYTRQTYLVLNRNQRRTIQTCIDRCWNIMDQLAGEVTELTAHDALDWALVRELAGKLITEGACINAAITQAEKEGFYRGTKAQG